MTILEKEFRIEAALHDTDYEFGSPLPIGKSGFTIAFHAGNCRRCGALIGGVIDAKVIEEIDKQARKSNELRH